MANEWAKAPAESPCGSVKKCTPREEPGFRVQKHHKDKRHGEVDRQSSQGRAPPRGKGIRKELGCERKTLAGRYWDMLQSDPIFARRSV